MGYKIKYIYLKICYIVNVFIPVISTICSIISNEIVDFPLDQRLLLQLVQEKRVSTICWQ